MKKVLVVLLSLCMVLGCFSFAFAGSYTDVADNASYAEAVEVLTAVGVIEGDGNGLYRPNDGLKRVEACVILVKLLDKAILGEVQTSTQFSDVPASYWGSGWVATAANLGLIEGYGDGTFGPEDPLTYDQWLTMVLRVMGYRDDILPGTWPTNFQVKALDLGLVTKATLGDKPATRANVADVAYEALTSPARVEYNAKGELVDGVGSINGPMASFLADRDDYVVDPMVIVPLGETGVLANYVGQFGDVYYKDKDGDGAVSAGDEAITFIANPNQVKIEGTYDGTTGGIITVSKTEKYDANPAAIYANTITVWNGEDLADATVAAIDADFDGLDVVVYAALDPNDTDASDGLDLADVYSVTAWEVTNEEQVADADEVAAIATALDTAKKNEAAQVTVTIGGNNYDIACTKGVPAVDVSGLVAGDIVSIYEDTTPEITKIVVCKDVVTGAITKQTTDPKYTINGTAYKASAAFAGDPALAVGTTGTWYLNQDGDIAAYAADPIAAVTTYYGLYQDKQDKQDASDFTSGRLAKISVLPQGEKNNAIIEIPSGKYAALYTGEVVANTYAAGDLVAYTVDDKGALATIEKVAWNAADLSAAQYTKAGVFNGKLVADKCVVVLDAAAAADRTFGTLKDIKRDTALGAATKYVLNAADKVSVVLVGVAAQDAGPVATNVAFFTGTPYKEGTTGAVYEKVEGMLNGVAHTFVSEKNETPFTDAGVTKVNFYEVTESNGAVGDATDIAPYAPAAVDNTWKALTDVQGNLIKTDGDYLNVPSPTVYVAVLNSAKTAITGWTIGSKSDIAKNALVQLYKAGTTAGVDADLVFVAPAAYTGAAATPVL